MTKPATPLPWTLEPCPHGGKILVRKGGAQSHLQIVPQDDAAYIVHACNAYPELVEMLSETVVYLRALLAKLGEGA